MTDLPPIVIPDAPLMALGGPMGAGKSTFTARLRRETDLLVIAFDEIRRDIQERSGLPREIWSPACANQTTGEIDARIRRALQERLSWPVIIELTFVIQGQVDGLSWQHSAPAHGIYIDATLDECLEGTRRRPVPPDEERVRDYYRDWEVMRERLQANPLEVGFAGVQILSRERAAHAPIIVPDGSRQLDGQLVCPTCEQPGYLSDGVFVCRNEACPEFGQVLAAPAGQADHHGAL